MLLIDIIIMWPFQVFPLQQQHYNCYLFKILVWFLDNKGFFLRVCCQVTMESQESVFINISLLSHEYTVFIGVDRKDKFNIDTGVCEWNALNRGWLYVGWIGIFVKKNSLQIMFCICLHCWDYEYTTFIFYISTMYMY